MVGSVKKRPFERCSRVSVEIQKVISDIIKSDIGDPRLENVTVTGVKMSKDLRIAKVYFAIYRSIRKTRSVTEGFISAKGYVKRELARKLRLRYMPEVVFIQDESFDYGMHMNRLFKSIEDTPEQ